MFVKKTIILYILFLFSVAVPARTVDSLLAVYSSGGKALRIEAANELSALLSDEGYCDSLTVFGRHSSGREIEASLFPLLAEYMRSDNRYQDAEALALRGVKAAEEENNQEMASMGYSTLCLCYQLSGDYERALDYAERCYEIERVSGVPEDLSSSLNNLSGLCLSLHHNEEAKQYIDKALEIERPLKRNGKLAIRLGMAGEIYSALGLYDDALKFCKEAYELESAAGDKSRIPVRECQLAAVYYAKGDLTEAEKWFKKAEGPLTDSGNQRSLSICLNSLGDIALAQDRDGEAEQWLLKAVEASRKSGYSMQLQKAYSKLARLLGRSRPSEAVDYYEKAASLRDSLFTAESQRQLNSFNVQYETFEKEHKIELQEAKIEKQHSGLLFMASILLLLAALAVVLVFAVRAQRRRNLQLQEMNMMKAKFFSIISHDLKNPIIAQKNALEAICVNYDHIPVDVLHSQCVELMRSSGSLLELLFNLLNWSRLETGRIAVNPVRFDLRCVCDEICSLLGTQLSNKGISLRVDLPEDVFVDGDRNMVTTVIRNLIGNAVKFSDSGSVIVLTAVRKGSFWEVSVKDSGVGMDKERVTGIFTLNCQKPSVGTAGEQGSGLGLVVCREMVELNGGEIAVNSAPGKGTEVTFTVKAA